MKWGLDLNQYPIIEELLFNIGVNPQQVAEEGKLFVFADNVNGYHSKITTLESMETYFGEFSLIYNDEGHLELISAGDKSIIITESDIAVVVFDNKSLSMIDQAKFEFANQKVSVERN